MKITSNALKLIASEMNSKLMGNHMSNVTVINSHDIFITFSMYRKEKMLISLNANNPFAVLTEIENPVGTVVGNLSDTLRKEVKEGSISSIETINDDRIIRINYLYTNDYFDRENRALILELIPHRVNMILLKEEKIIYATRYVDITNDRPIMKGLVYQPLKNNNSLEDKESFNLDVFKQEAKDYYLEAKHKRLEEQFKPVLQHIKSRIKTLKHKIDILHKEMDAATEQLSYQEVGQMILTLSYDKEQLDNYIKENNFSYDNALTPGVNASKYFNKYKKAKRTLEIDKNELVKTDDEIHYLEDCLAESKYMNEDDIMELANLLFPNKFKLGSHKKLDAKPSEIIVEDVKISFGKNAKQNDYLTFKKANKTDQYIHIKDEHGSHVIIHSQNPSNEVILTACEIALLLSGKECGEVQHALIKDVKKGSFMGQALLTSYQTYNIKSIRQSTKQLLKR